MNGLDLGIIGNGTIAGIINSGGDYQWLCLPRFDGEPVFNHLLGGGGRFDVWMDDLKSRSQSYDTNTSILRTRLESEDGAVMDIIDFAPRFEQRGRVYRPATIVRRFHVVAGAPRIRITLTPETDWGGRKLAAVRGVNHIRFTDGEIAFRVTTDAPVSYVMSGTSFILEQDVSFILGADESLSDTVDVITLDWEERTRQYWMKWSRSLAVPFEWQDEVIRAAITLKLCVFEETGGIVAALTTSIPEHEGSERNWDYRFCWIRDAYFSVSALNRLSAMGTLEHYMRWVRNIVTQSKGGHIQPVYGIGLESVLTEELAPNLPGFRDTGPVRRGNQAAEHIQHDVYGQVVLGVAQSFFDRRLLSPPGVPEFRQLEPVGERAFAVHDTPDAGIWEFRTIADVHTSSAIMCWAACDRLSRIAAQLGLGDRQVYWAERAAIIHKTVLDKAWNPDVKAFTATFGGTALDASVLLMAEIGFLAATDPRYIATVEAIDSTLREGNHVYRYKTADDFGRPKTAFTACTFWHIDALYRIGRADEAREMFESVLATRNHVGLLSEDVDPATGELWGNFPQTYCMVGIINSAALLSKPWTSVI
ncbi:glycoside hydrolase family 15 protein [Hyphomonas johnsonii]|uniref:Glycoside hydrolase 15-like protein n=1 Tax=Hyphomonas johnsonii MHS-2 TaxID=1280950 RepID=A0A059FUP1_9PROT|nr:glycoside hydrolase family 15 protein [Hyphomonas johnsonii]KCZ94327.1 glycoside hydrolase 15-like protein [Hyphomonas johnsonii MHS-2]